MLKSTTFNFFVLEIMLSFAHSEVFKKDLRATLYGMVKRIFLK